MLKKQNFRGYIFSRKIDGNFIPQRVQNLVIKDFCNRNNFFFKLSATEYKMINSYMMLKSLLKNLKNLDGIVFYSLFMLPDDKIDRVNLIQKIFIKKKKIAFALEEIIVESIGDFGKVETIYNIKKNSKKL